MWKMSITIWLLSIFGFCADVPATYEAYDMTKWENPVLFGAVPFLHGDKLYVFDQYQSQLKAYDISFGWENPKFLWRSPGEGQGPGETPKGIYLKNIAVDEPTQRVWLAHSRGFHVFEGTGRFVKYIKRPYSESLVLPRGDHLYITSPNVVDLRYAVLKMPVDGGKPLWKLPNPEELPVVEDGGIINPEPELHFIDGKIIYYESTTGELILVNEKGEIDLIAYNKNVFRPKYTPVSTMAKRKRGVPYTILRQPHPRSGLTKINGDYYCLSITYGKGVKTALAQHLGKDYGVTKNKMRLLSRISEQGQLLGQFFHALSLEEIAILGYQAGKLVLFEQEEGEKIFTISPDAFLGVEQVIP